MKVGLERPYTVAYTKRMTNRQRGKGGGAVDSRAGGGGGLEGGAIGSREQDWKGTAFAWSAVARIIMGGATRD